MNDQCPADVDPSCPAVEIPLRRFFGVTAVNEQQPQRHSPTAGHDRRLADDRHHMVVKPRGVKRVAQRRQRVEQAGDLVDHRCVVVLPSGLVFLGAVMVIDRVDHATGLLRRGAEQHRGFTAVRTDFDACAVTEILHGGVVERVSFVGGHESDDLLGEGEEFVRVAHRRPTYRCW